jgi:ABC-type multidrug transport system permease subunit
MMSSINKIGAVFFKSLKRMFKSKLTLATIFIGPFFLLFLLQGAYQTSGTINLEIGIVDKTNNSDIFSAFSSSFYSFKYRDIDSCLKNVKKGNLDLCILIDSFGNYIDVFFYLDKSRINSVNLIKDSLSSALLFESSKMSYVFLDEMIDNISMSTSNINDLVDILDDYNNGNSLPTFDVNYAQLGNNLDEMEDNTKVLYYDTNSDLNDFKSKVIEIKENAIVQKEIIENLKNNNNNCDEDLDDLEYSYYYGDQSDFKDDFVRYGECKCIEYYDENLNSILNNLNQVISYSDDVLDDLDLAKKRNYDFYVDVTDSLDLQKDTINDFSDSENELIRSINEKNDEFNYLKSDLTTSLSNLEYSISSLVTNVNDSKNGIVTPIRTHVESISEERDLIVYLFPTIYFFILMFIALMFSSTYIYSEKTSKANQRNRISPMNAFIEYFGVFISFIMLITIQSILILGLGNIFFKFNLSVAIFIKIILITDIVISLYLLIGMIFGIIFKTQLMVVFFSIGFSILSFLYSNLISISNTLTDFARFLISVNPFAIASNSISKILLFNVSLDIFLNNMSIIIFQLFIVLIVFCIIVFLKIDN